MNKRCDTCRNELIPGVCNYCREYSKWEPRSIILDPEILIFKQETKSKENPTPKYYNYQYKGIKLDPYRIAEVYGIISHPQFHALKKILRAHTENHKPLDQNIDEAISALMRWKEIIQENNNAK